MKGKVYVVQIGSDGPIKIGMSANIPKRIASLQVGIPWPLRLLAVIDGTWDYEIYHRFSSSRMNGEWFYPTRELLAYIAKPTKLPQPNPKSWKRARKRRGSNLTFLRPVLDYCSQDQQGAA